MRRTPLACLLVALVLVGLTALTGAPAPTSAQSATPQAGMAMPPGVTFTALALGQVATLPAAPADLGLFRMTMAAGATYTISANDPSLALVLIEAGTLTFKSAGPTTVTRAAAMMAMATPGAAMMPATETIPANTSTTLNPGDSLVGLPNVAADISNAGTQPVSVLVALVAPAMGGPMATPAA
jgi:hypothetical protein